MTKIHKAIAVILRELLSVLRTVSDAESEQMILEILQANKIVGIGAGRVGMAVRGFVMRLGHLGLNAYMWGDATVPACGPGDLVFVASGSGETQTVAILVEIAKKNGARVVLVTGNPESRMGKIADVIVQVKAPSKTKPAVNLTSVQPMTTLNEQCLGLFFDAIVLVLMEKMNETHDTMWARHSNLE